MNDETKVERELAARRRFLAGAGLLAAGTAGALVYQSRERLWNANVAIAKADSYDDDLASIITRGLRELGLKPDHVKGKRIMLKPNLVEPTRDSPHINTHPNIVRAVAESLLQWGARDVFVAEGQGHVRDSNLVLEESGLGRALDDVGVDFVDLNHDEIVVVPNALGMTSLDRLYLPATLVRRADWVVSLPKMKTHHWSGVTLALKNLFGVMPGICYGWPKNVLHYEGIGRSILDIYATVRPRLAIIDGIVGMEGDGPIMGTAKPAGVLVMGTNLPAVDATAARLMGVDPWRIDYLAAASGRFGPIESRNIRQRGESIRNYAQTFRFVDHPSLDRFRG
jgi:uncharacterized protein (DUF362 family)